MTVFYAVFSNQEKKVLQKYNVIIKNNKRYYIFQENAFIPMFAAPAYYKILDFAYIGTNWVDLFTNFVEWIISKHPDEDFKNFRSRGDKLIFSTTTKPGFTGPLSNGLYLGNNYGVKTWLFITDILVRLRVFEHSTIVVTFPFHREYPEIGELFWRKEVVSFYKYLRLLGYSDDRAKTHTGNLRKLNELYRQEKRRVDAAGFIYDISNPYILTVDDRQTMSNTFSLLKRKRQFLKKYITTLNHVAEFKKELHYRSLSYSSHKTDFLHF